MSDINTSQAAIVKTIAKELVLDVKAVNNVVQLLTEGNTIPFIARYRKELTGSLDEVTILKVWEKWEYINSLNTRKEEVIRLISEQGKLTDELSEKIHQAQILQEVEDLYRPFRQKRRTKAMVAREKGLEPFALWMLSFPKEANVLKEAEKYISEEHDLNTVEDVIQGAKDIIAEVIADDPGIRGALRDIALKEGILQSTVKDKSIDEKNTYEVYYEYEQLASKMPSHRVLAINRGEKEEVLRVKLVCPAEKSIAYIQSRVINSNISPVMSNIEEAIEDSYKRLIEPSIEREIRREITQKAEEQAINVFAKNLRNLLLQPPLKNKIVLGIDPAYRTGCKLAVVDETGKLLAVNVIYPTPPKKEIQKSKEVVKSLVNKYLVNVIAIGNGTASRETEQFIVETIKELNNHVPYIIVNEAGASVYSASSQGREEFPDLQVEERSAVSIARRIQDPLAELVKIDPKSVGVGQYQHDVSQQSLNSALKFVVETAVNQVGVNVNTASVSLLQYAAGLNKTVAANIVNKRDEDGRFANRDQLKNVKKLGKKTYEQCIGFLRIMDGDNPLDRTGIHPETYKETRLLLKHVGLTEDKIGSVELKEALGQINIDALSAKLELGKPTLTDIINNLISPERDPRDQVPKPILRTDVLQIQDLKKGMELQGTVRNVVDFGAFVDIGVKEDGLVHISKLSRNYVKHPMEVVSVGDVVTVWVDNLDMNKGRISLRMVQD
ncbi:Tex family protein [Desulfitibacter alkalitolerans]|uniref:Tex family protein n=1 Tax=Desulfitibacter alkalitolerans TaxID=264641 RepID=UPI0004889CBA|nr:Tex family protein [Desulfitibacter alkalitolerans]